MPQQRHFSRINTAEVKSQIFKRVGRVRAEKYFYNLKRMLNFKLSKSEFKKLCYVTIGRENIALHNLFLQSILKNALLARTPPTRETAAGNSQNSKVSNGSFGDTFPSVSPFKGKPLNNWDQKFKDRPSPLGPYGSIPPGSVQEISGSCDIKRLQEQHGAFEMMSVGSKAMLEVGSVEDGEEVEQVRGSPCVQSRSPVRAPFGIPMSVGDVHRALRNDHLAAFRLPKTDIPDTCHSCSELPDTMSLRKCLEHKVEREGLGLSLDCVNLLNTSLDVFLKRLIKPCVDLARSRCSNGIINEVNGNMIHGMNGLRQGECMQAGECMQTLNHSFCASLLDFRVAMESSPQLLGEYWPIQLEKIFLRASEER